MPLGFSFFIFFFCFPFQFWATTAWISALSTRNKSMEKISILIITSTSRSVTATRVAYWVLGTASFNSTWVITVCDYVGLHQPWLLHQCFPSHKSQHQQVRSGKSVALFLSRGFVGYLHVCINSLTIKQNNAPIDHDKPKTTRLSVREITVKLQNQLTQITDLS